MRFDLLLFFTLLCFTFSFELHALFTNNMVLQRDETVHIYGKSAGQQVKVILGDKEFESNVSNGKFSVAIPPQPATTSGSLTLIIQELPSGQRKVLTNVLFGDNYVCSGQSNMRWAISQSSNPASEIQESLRYPNVRHFFVQTNPSDKELEDIKSSSGWQLPSNGTTGSFSAVCWAFGRSLHQRMKIPIGLIHSSVGGTRIDLWMSKDIVNGCTKDEKLNQPTYLYNGMIHPLIKYNVKGALWYQGESNAGDRKYPCKKRLMVQDWRKKWNNKMIFLYVQLAGYQNGDFIAIRWEQDQLQNQVENVGMATAIDIGHKTDIHPRNKRDVGERLQLIAARKIYNQNVLFHGPTIQSFTSTRNGNKLTVTVKYNERNDPISLRNTEDCTTCCSKPNEMFDLEGNNNQIYVPDSFKIENNEIIFTVTIPQNVNISRVRYLWKRFVECVVIGQTSKLPSTPFISNLN